MTESSPVEEVFFAALALATTNERSSFLDQACGSDSDLRRRVERMLNAHPKVGSFLRRPAGVDPAQTIPPEQTATSLRRDEAGTLIDGRYRLLDLVGEGGMGSVWRAEQIEPVRRQVAIKLVKPGMDSKGVLARFEAERQALALMDHPNIAKVFDGGTSDLGRPYFAMELVQGLAFTDYCEGSRLSIRERLALFVQICSAVQHAHQKGVIHRDLKPTNILVVEQDGVPVPRVIDFGLAKALHDPLTLDAESMHTAYGMVVGTPLYMAPEQVGTNAIDVDTRADIYSLGAILYELLTGVTPLERDHCKGASWEEIRRLIRDVEPIKPSVRLSSSDILPSLAEHRRTEPARLPRLVSGELDWIVLKALEKDRDRRYATANGLALDIERYLADEPVSAGPPSAVYRVRKFVRRNRAGVLAASIMLLLLVAGIGGTTWGMIRAEERADGEAKERWRANEAEQIAINERDRANQEKATAEAVRTFLQVDLLSQANPWAQALSLIKFGGDGIPKNPTVRELLDRAAKQVTPDRIERKFPRQPLVQAEVLHTIGETYETIGEAVKAIPLLERSRVLRAKHLGSDDPSTLKVIRQLALAHWECGNAKVAIGLLEGNIAVLQRTRGAEDLDTLITMENLGMIKRAEGKVKEAIGIYEKVYDVRLRLHGPDHWRTLITYNNLAASYQADRRLAEAIRILERVRSAWDKAPDVFLPERMTALNNLAGCYVEALRYSEAIELLELVRDTQSKHFDWDHHLMLTVLNNLGVVYQRMDRLPDAIQVLEQVRDLRLKKYGPDHQQTLATLNNLATAYLQANHLSEAISILQDAVPKARRNPGPRHATTYRMTGNWVVGLEANKQFSEAVAVAKEWLDNERREFPVSHMRWTEPMYLMGRSLLKSAQYAECEKVLRECIAIREAKQPDGWNTYDARSLLGQALYEQNKFADAEPLLVRGCQGMIDRQDKLPAFAVNHLRQRLDCLIRLYEKTGKPNEAAKWRAKMPKPAAASPPLQSK